MVNDLLQQVTATAAEYKQCDPGTLEADSLGNAATGPEVYEAVLRELNYVDEALKAACAA
jgi:hypothetical protein